MYGNRTLILSLIESRDYPGIFDVINDANRGPGPSSANAKILLHNPFLYSGRTSGVHMMWL